MAKDDVRLLMVGLHQGWDVEKISKETKLGIDDVSRLLADIEEQRLAFAVDEYESRPGFPVIRERELEKFKTEESLKVHAQELARLFQANWKDIETTVSSLAGAKGVPKDELMYQIVVSGLLYGAMLDVFFEDQTLLVPPPRRVGSQRYYGWLIEGDARLAGNLKREQWESEGHYIVSIGTTLQKDRVSLSQIRSENGMILDEAESRRFRSFLSVFSRDKLLPFFKKNRTDLFAATNKFETGMYARRTDVFSWYYDQMVNRAVDDLIKSGNLKTPNRHYTYAVRTPTR
jgi:hypothetical protein